MTVYTPLADPSYGSRSEDKILLCFSGTAIQKLSSWGQSWDQELFSGQAVLEGESRVPNLVTRTRSYSVVRLHVLEGESRVPNLVTRTRSYSVVRLFKKVSPGSLTLQHGPGAIQWSDCSRR